jgi:carbonic anhydrase
MPDERPKTAARALARLKAGNKRYVDGRHELLDEIADRRRDSAGGQRPYAVILSCADSRVSPELIFDESVGALFVCRVAGNISTPQILGSVEYAVASFGSPLVMVLGHQRCGAVTATVELLAAGEQAEGSAQSIVDAIAPVVHATKRGRAGEAAYLDKVIRANARAVAESIAKQSEIIRDAVAARKLKVVSGRYSLDSGKVVLLS